LNLKSEKLISSLCFQNGSTCNHYTEARADKEAAAEEKAAAKFAADAAAKVVRYHFSPRYCCASKHGSIDSSQQGPCNQSDTPRE
jgi:hypothetical protein